MKTKSGKLLLITGLPAAGKDTIAQLFLQRNPDFKFIVSHTDRPIRRGETQGVHHYFVSVEYFEAMIAENKFLEYVKTGLYYKGTSKEEFSKVLSGKNTAWRVELTRFASFEKTIEDNFGNPISETIIESTTKIMLMPESKDIALKRYSQRDGTSKLEDFEKRWDFEWDFYQKNIERFPHVVTNFTGKQLDTVKGVENIIKKRGL